MNEIVKINEQVFHCVIPLYYIRGDYFSSR